MCVKRACASGGARCQSRSMSLSASTGFTPPGIVVPVSTLASGLGFVAPLEVRATMYRWYGTDLPYEERCIIEALCRESIYYRGSMSRLYEVRLYGTRSIPP